MFIANPTVVKTLLASAALLTGAIVFIRLGPSLTAAWRKASGLGRCLFIFGSLALALYGGSKNGGVGGRCRAEFGDLRLRLTEADGNPLLPCQDDLISGEAESFPLPVCPAFIKHPIHLRLVAVENEPEHSFACPAVAESNAFWFAHGAREAWCEVPGHGIAFTGGHLRPSPRSDAGMLGYYVGDWMNAVAGRSRLWWTSDTVTWEDFGADASQNVQIAYGNPFVIRVNSTAYYFAEMYSTTNDTSLAFNLTAPFAVFRGGCALPLSVSWSSLRDIRGTVTLEQTAGFGKVAFWEDAEGIVPAVLPIEVDAHNKDAISLYVSFAAPSAAAEDIAFTATLRGELDGEDDGAVRMASMTAVEVLRMDVSSSVAGFSTNPPPFAVGSESDFDVTHSVPPDQHLVIPFDNVSDASLAFSDFTVDFSLVVNPSDYSSGTSWELCEDSPLSGELVTDGNAAELLNPSEGGVYRIAATLGGIRTVGTVVLPLAGAEMCEVLLNDLARADTFAGWASNVLAAATNELQRIALGYMWFIPDERGFYLGRPDSAAEPTVWQYNQVRDSDGKGAVGTLFGRSIRIEKLSNLIVGYACEKIGVTSNEQAVAQMFGTANDESAFASWQAGVDLARGADFTTTVSNLAFSIWGTQDAKNRHLWPNAALVDNVTTNFPFDVNRRFRSPGFLYLNN